MKLSTDEILNAATDVVQRMVKDTSLRHLDIGPGHGDLIALLRSKFGQIFSSACDYTTHLMHLTDVPIKVVDLNTQNLPYENAEFNLITCTEVIEHLENHRQLIREIHRVLSPGGTVVITTPNILNLKSRVRFFLFGFYNLFGPLHFRESELHSTGGHINPVGLFYLFHALADAGFENIELSIDKAQKTSLFWGLVFYLPIHVLAWFIKRKEVKKFKTIDKFNQPFVDMINAWPILVGRTIVVGCKKPDPNAVNTII
jgi:SAM-dependent methyltransferase